MSPKLLSRIFERVRGAARPPEAKHVPAPFIIGGPRSGTTLLRFMLNAHRDLAIPPETGFSARLRNLKAQGRDLSDPGAIMIELIETTRWHLIDATSEEIERAMAGASTLSEALRRYYRLFATKRAKKRWGDKTPVHARQMAIVASYLPEAHFVHIIRDGRDTALSLRKTTFTPSQDIGELAEYWAAHVTEARRAAREGFSPYMELRYEQLLENPERELRRICTFVDLPYDPAMLEFRQEAEAQIGRELSMSPDADVTGLAKFGGRPNPARIFAWRSVMSPEDRERFESVAGPLLAELGYETL